MLAPTASFKAIWAFVAVYGVWSGWQLPSSPQGGAFPTGALGVALALLPGVAIAIAGVATPLCRALPWPTMKEPVNKLLGAGTYEYLFLSAGIALLLGTGAFITGLLALVRALVSHADDQYFLTASFFLSGGTGMLVVFAAEQRRARQSK